jgi:hypothetical protein
LATVTGPLFSFDARKKVGKAIVFKHWKGRNTVVRRVKPAQPRTASQKSVRAFTGVNAPLYTGVLTASNKTNWKAKAKTGNITPVNAMVRDAQAQRKLELAIRQDPTLAAGAAPGPPTAFTATAGKGQVSLAWTNSLTGTLFTTQIHITPGATITPASANCVKIVKSATTAVVITRLPAGTYTASVVHGEPGGTRGTPVAAPVTFTTT